MNNRGGYDPFDAVALFNTFIGLVNVEKNASQREEQEIIKQKLDRILSLLEGGNEVGKE